MAVPKVTHCHGADLPETAFPSRRLSHVVLINFLIGNVIMTRDASRGK